MEENAVVTVAQIDLATARDLLGNCLHDDLQTALSAGYEVYAVPPTRIRPDSTNATEWFYFTKSLAENAPLGTVESPNWPRLGQVNKVSAALTPSREHGSGMIIRSDDEGEHLSVLEALELALVPYPRNSFQRNIGVKNAGAQSIHHWRDIVQIVD